MPAIDLAISPHIAQQKPRIAVAMSGGVDSSMVAVLLAKAGFEIIGFTAWTLNGPGKCCNDALINAGRVCEQLGMPYDTVDVREAFAHYVMDYYENAYKQGLTPNPCVECNRHIKWERLVDYARTELKADYVATGHYSQIEHAPDGSFQVFPGVDSNKDQTYMLSRVRAEDLRHTLFPLGRMTKPDVVALAKEYDIPTAHSKESQDVCFVLNGQADYIRQTLGEKPGQIIDKDTGNVLGTHPGYWFFTLGQRKGVGVAAGRPVYVVEINAASNTVYLGDAHHLACPAFEAVQVNWLSQPEAPSFEAWVKFRYNTPPALAQCQRVGDTVQVRFLEPASAVTPGQIAAFYHPKTMALLGGGYIGTHLPHTPFEPGTRNLPSFDEACQIFR